MKSKNGLLGNNSKICCGNVLAAISLAWLAISLPLELSALPKSIDEASSPNTSAEIIPMIAAIATVPIKKIKYKFQS